MEAVAIAAITLTAVSSIRQGYEQETQLKTQAGMADRDAELARREAAYKDIEARQIGRKGEIEQDLQAEKARFIMGNLRARMAQGGMDITTGSPLDLIGSTAETQGYERDLMAWDTRMNVWKTKREGSIFLDRAKILNTQAGIYRTNAKQAVIGGYLSAAGFVRSQNGNRML